MTQRVPRVLIAGLNGRLLLLLIVAILPIFGFFIASGITHRQDALARAGESLQSVARLAAMGAERHVEGTRQLLSAVSSGPSLRNSALNGLCSEFLANIRGAYPHYTNLAFLDARGSIVCHALKTELADSDKDRSYFVEATKNSAFAMSDYQVGQVTGVASIGFGKPVYGQGATLKGMAYAGLDVQQLALALKGALPPNVQVTLTDRYGTILGTDSSQSADRVGTRLQDMVLANAQKILPGKTVQALDPSGAMRLYAVAAVADDTGPGLYVLASMAQSAVTAPAWRELQRQLLWVTSMALLGILLAYWIANRTLIEPARRLVRKINQMGHDGTNATQGIAGSTGVNGINGPPAPVGGQDEIHALSSAFDRFSQLIKQRNTERDQQQCRLEKVQAKLLTAQRIAKIGNWEFDLTHRTLWWSEQTYLLFGRDQCESAPILNQLHAHVFHADRAHYRAARRSLIAGENALDLEMRVVLRGGKVRWFHALGEMVRDNKGQPMACAGTVQDITDRVVNARLIGTEAQVLQALSQGKPLQAVLEEVLTGLESILPGARTSVMLLSADKQRLHFGAAPHLPDTYNQALEGMRVGPDIGSYGSCGSAAHLGQTVVVGDIANSLLSASYRALALAHGLRACWSIPLKDADGAVLAIFAAYYDEPRAPHPEELAWAHSAAAIIGVAIQRDRHEAALRASEQRFRRCFQGAATGMAIATLEGRLVEVNQAYCDMLGYSEQELYGMDIQATAYARHWPLTQAQFLDLTEGRTACFVVENHCQAKSGELVWIRNSVSLLRGATGQPEGFIGIAEDTTRQRRAFDQLRLLETAVSRLNDIVMITEAEPINEPGPRIVFVNDAFERRTGYSREESLGQSPRFLQGPKTQRTEQDRIRAALLQFKPVRAELINYRKSGQAFWLELDIVPIADDTGWFTHWVGVGRDITERKQSQLDVLQLNADLEDRVRVRTVQLESANRELEAFSYSVSHDLRSPLNTVNGFGQLLQKSNADNLNDKGKHYLSRIRAGTQQMGELIEGLLSLAKLSRNALRPERVDLTASAVRVDQECREREPDRQVGLRVQPDMVARGDATLLLLVMQNLVGNAWKYTSKQTDARIDVGSELSDSGETVYFVRDNGAGFDMAHADKLFGAFQRLHAPSDFAGNGVGLANVKRVVERHGGRVWAEGHLDSGATFFFTLACPDV